MQQRAKIIFIYRYPKTRVTVSLYSIKIKTHHQQALFSSQLGHINLVGINLTQF